MNLQSIPHLLRYAAIFAIAVAVACSGGSSRSPKKSAAEDDGPPPEPPPFSVSVDFPTEGFVFVGTVVAEGSSEGAVDVSLVLDNQQTLNVNGVEQWDFVFEPGFLAPGDHQLKAVAVDADGNETSDSVEVHVQEPAAGVQEVSYHSSVDAEELKADLYLPDDFDPDGDPVPLVIHLHGGGGSGTVNIHYRDELDRRDWIGLAPAGRKWKLAEEGCNWSHSAAYVDSFDPSVGPGERDILDAIDWAVDGKLADPDRIYLSGGSMGGRGTYAIGLKNPDRFAAISPLQPAIDMYEIFARRPEPRECKEGMMGGRPGDDPLVDTMYTITSGRFLIENAFNLPVFHAHALQDHVANNDPAFAPFLHGFHITIDPTFDDCHQSEVGPLCFGHTPTLRELRERHPEGYDWAYFFTNGGHDINAMWIEGAPMADEDAVEGVEDSENPGYFLGTMEFFSRRTLVKNPRTIVYKTYTDNHRTAYWATIDITTPWLDKPGAIRAIRNRPGNVFQVELVRVAAVTLDLTVAEMLLDLNNRLRIQIEELLEPAFDPALVADGGETLEPEIRLLGDFSEINEISVLIDGTEIPKGQYSLSATMISMDSILVTGTHVIDVFVTG